MIEYFNVLNSRKNATHLWCTGDTPELYREYNERIKSPNLYKPGGFTYKYNDYGFRCDDFSLSSDINIVFLGCSMTEGCGLPVETVWAYQLLNRIRQKTNKNICYWNLALAGMGIDSQSFLLHWFSRMKNIDYVFSFIPPLNRREYLYDLDRIQYWNMHMQNPNRIIVDELFSDKNYMMFQNYRSLMIIESIILNRSIMYCTSWDISETADILKLKEFNSLNYFLSYTQFLDYARDGAHPGPRYHNDLCDSFWNEIEHLF